MHLQVYILYTCSTRAPSARWLRTAGATGLARFRVVSLLPCTMSPAKLQYLNDPKDKLPDGSPNAMMTMRERMLAAIRGDTMDFTNADLTPIILKIFELTREGTE